MSRLSLPQFEVDGKTYAASDIISGLSPFLTPQRLSRLAQTVSQRRWSVATVLENIYDYGNANAVMRSAEAFGFINFNIIESPDAAYKRANRVTQGAHKWLLTRKFSSTGQCVSQLKSEGYRVAATDLQASKTIFEMDFSQPVAMVFGNEKQGISDEMRELADETFLIPMPGMVQSFNISVAAALSFFHAFSRLQEGGVGDLTEIEKQQLMAQYILQTCDRAGQLLSVAGCSKPSSTLQESPL